MKGEGILWKPKQPLATVCQKYIQFRYFRKDKMNLLGFCWERLKQKNACHSENTNDLIYKVHEDNEIGHTIIYTRERTETQILPRSISVSLFGIIPPLLPTHSHNYITDAIQP